MDKSLLFIAHLGVGMTSRVDEYQYENEKVAVKIFKASLSIKERQNEIFIALTLNHPNLMKIICHTDDYIMMPLCRSLANESKYDVCYYISMGLQHMHSRNIVHRDIKSLNVMVLTMPLLADFGFSVVVEPQKMVPRHVGTKCYMAPELCTTQSLIHSQQLFACDMYSLGVLMFEIVMGYLPYNTPSVSNTKYDWMQQWQMFWQRQKTQSSTSFQKIIQNLLSYSPKERWNIDRLVEELSLAETLFMETNN